jgi:hypothetical protein
VENATTLAGPLHPGLLLAAWHGRVQDLDYLATQLPEEDLLTDPARPTA